MIFDQEFERYGFLVVRSCASEQLLENVDQLCAKAVGRQTEEQRKAHRAFGSLLDVTEEAELAPIALSPELLNLIGPAMFNLGMVFHKPAFSPPAFWHQDNPDTDDPVWKSSVTHHLMVMLYLRDTAVETGCLRVIPGTHRVRHELHKLTEISGEEWKALRKELRTAADLTHPAFADYAEQVAVPVRRGDVVIADSRLIHGAFGNNSPVPRPLLTLWYFRDLAKLSKETTDSELGRTLELVQGWPEEYREHFRSIGSSS